MRVNDWETHLYTVLNSFNEKPFQWGSHDCCTFAADCVLAITGSDKMSRYRGGYKSAKSAARKLEAAGGLEAALTFELGDPVAPLMAKRGDVVCFTSALGDTAGICIGATIAAAGLDGITYTPMSQAFKSWSI